MGKTVFDVFEAAIIDSVESAKAGKTKTSGKKSDQDDDDPPSVSDRWITRRSAGTPGQADPGCHGSATGDPLSH
jgi:hypothetical protein